MNLLDQILDNQGPARIVGGQHDINQIDVGEVRTGGLPSEGLKRQIQNLSGNGFWDAAEYGISREEQIVKLKASLTKALEFEKSPEGIEKARKEVEAALNAMRQRAINRARLDTTNGRVNIAINVGADGKNLPWYKLGTYVDRPMRAKEARTLGGLGWEIEKVNILHNGEPTDRYFLVRSDTKARIDERTVGEVYEPTQHQDGFDFLDEVLGDFGARYDCVGSLNGGKQVFMSAYLPDHGFTINGTDRQESYVLWFNPCDGISTGKVLPTSTRTVCANTSRVAIANANKIMKFRHTGSTKNQIQEAKQILGLAVKGFEQYKDAAESLAKKPIKMLPYINNVLDAVLDVTEAQVKAGPELLAKMIAKDDADRELKVKFYERQIEQRKNILEDIIERADNERNAAKGIRGTAWQGYNSITEHVDHNTLGRKVGTNQQRDTRRLESILAGEGDQMKQVAFEKALAL